MPPKKLTPFGNTSKGKGVFKAQASETEEERTNRQRANERG